MLNKKLADKKIWEIRRGKIFTILVVNVRKKTKKPNVKRN